MEKNNNVKKVYCKNCKYLRCHPCQHCRFYSEMKKMDTPLENDKIIVYADINNYNAHNYCQQYKPNWFRKLIYGKKA